MTQLPDLYRSLDVFLRGRKKCVLATVLSCRGSGPREAGAVMLFSARGPEAGTVGGGLLEAKVSLLAAEVMKKGRPVLETFRLDASIDAGEGMICGGTMELLVHRIWPSPPGFAAVWRRALESLKSRRPCAMVTSLEGNGSELRTGVGLISSTGADAGTLPVAADELRALIAEEWNAPVLLRRKGRRFFIQPLKIPEKVFVFGAGHIAHSLVPLCRRVGFFPVVIDDRMEFADRKRFPEAGAVVRVDSFESSYRELVIDENTYLVAVTRGHRHDLEVISRALQTPARYIGMIGSSRKRNSVFGALRGRGVSEEELRRIRCPVGVSIGARTPEEIAVSIVAEMIAFRAGHEAGEPGKQ